MVNVNAFYNIEGWMINEFKGKGKELDCFAIIYSYSRGELGKFVGGFKCLAGLMNCSETTASRFLDSLIEKGLVIKDEIVTNTGRRTFYRTDEEKVNTIREKQFKLFEKDILSKRKEGYFQNESMGTFKMKVNNKYSNNQDIENKRLSNDNQKKGGSSSRFVKPTIEQIEAYIKEKGYHFDAEHFWNYYESKGWKVGNSPMKNWKAACATWESKRKSENPDKSEETTDLPAGLTTGKWEQARNWFKTRVPRIAGSITPNDHLSMMALARWKRDVYIEILIKIEASDYTGSILEEFERISETEEYSQRLWGNE